MIKLPKRTLGKVASIYNLGKVKSTKFISGGNINYNFAVKTDRGDFVVRKLGYILDGWFSKQKSFEFKVLDFLHEQKFPYKIPKMLCGKDKQYISDVDGSLFQVYPEIEGRTVVNLSSAQLKEAAKALAIYHKIIEKFPSDPEEIDDLGYTRGNYNNLRKVKVVNSVDKYMAKHLDFFENIFKETAKIDRNKDVLIVHGDFRKNNLLFSGSKLVGIVDWENVEWAPKTWDFVSDVTDGAKAIQTFVTEYQKYNSLSPNEINMVVPLKLLKISEIFPWAYKGEHAKPEKRLSMLRDLVKRAKKHLTIWEKNKST